MDWRNYYQSFKKGWPTWLQQLARYLCAFFIYGALFNSSWGRFASGSQTTPKIRNQMDHDKFATASGLCGLFAHRSPEPESLEVVAASASLTINCRKTKTLSLTWNANGLVQVAGEQTAAVDKFTYLGTDLDIESWIKKTRSAFGILFPNWRNANLSTALRLKLFKSNVSVLHLEGKFFVSTGLIINLTRSFYRKQIWNLFVWDARSGAGLVTPFANTKNV